MKRSSRLRRMLAVVSFCGLLGACVTRPPVEERVEESAMLPLLGYFQLLQQLSPQELARERSVLAMAPATAVNDVRMAMLLGQPRGPLDLPRAQSLLDGVLKANTAEAASLHPLARMLASQYQELAKLAAQNDKLASQQQERQKFETQADRLTAQHLKECQRRNDELQDKLDAITNIERSLSTRPPGRDGKPVTPP